MLVSEAHRETLERARQYRGAQEPEEQQSEPVPVGPETRPVVIAPLFGTHGVPGARVASKPPRRRFRFLTRWASFWRAMLGGRVSKSGYRDRMAECVKCPQRIAELTERRGKIRERWYCAACQCPRWIMSRLTVKNKLRGWHCPMRKHEGPYPDDAVRMYLTVHGYATEEQLKQVGGCRGCGS